MKFQEVRRKAQEMGIKAGKIKKSDLIRKIQKEEGNQPCFGTSQGICSHADCCFLDDCFRE